MLTAKELTGAPLISYVPKNRKLKKKMSEPVGVERMILRQRHCSDQSQSVIPGLDTRLGPQAPSQYYLGQNLYQKLMGDPNPAYLQDFYRNPAFSVYRQNNIQHQQHSGLKRDNVVSKSFDNLSDTFSVSSDESENFIPRIIRPRRRRKKEKRRSIAANVSEAEESSCLGSEKQWLPTGLLSAESSFDSRSDCSGSSEEEVTINSLHVRRKLGTALSVPAYTSYTGSDYSSMTSSTSSSHTPASSSTDQLNDSDSCSIPSMSPPPIKQTLKQTKSQTSCSYFRSPKVTQKGVCVDPSGGVSPGSSPHTRPRSLHLQRPRPLRKTHSWAFTSGPDSEHNTGCQEAGPGQFSLFSPGTSIDLLSGIRKNLSRLDLRADADI